MKLGWGVFAVLMASVSCVFAHDAEVEIRYADGSVDVRCEPLHEEKGVCVWRRTLLIIGSIGCIVAHFAAAAAFLCNLGLLAAACIFLFIVFFAMGQGVVIWVFISEIFPQKFRAQGQSWGSFTHWSFCAALTFVFPLMAAKWPTWSIFAFFGVCLVAHLLWATFVCPETKGRALEE